MLIENNELFDALVNAYKARYADILEPAFPQGVSPHPQAGIVLINLNDILNTICVQLHNLIYTSQPALRYSPYYLTSQLLNLAGHYKHFFRKRYADYPCKPYVIFYYSLTSMVEKSTRMPVKNYTNTLQANLFSLQESVKSSIFEALQIMGNTVQCIPHVYMINSGDIPLHLVPYHIMYSNYRLSFEKPVYSSIVLVSSNPLDYTMLVSSPVEGILFRRKMPNTCFKDQIINNVLKSEGLNVIPPRYYKYILALVGNVKVNMPAVAKYAHKKHLIELFRSSLFYDYSITQGDEILLNRIKDELTPEQWALFNINLNITDSDKLFTQWESSLDTLKHAWNVDYVDYSIEEINSTYFNNCKIDLYRLCE